MKIKMLQHYHGKLSKDVHFNSGSDQSVAPKVGNELIDRGYAIEPRKKVVAEEAAAQAK